MPSAEIAVLLQIEDKQPCLVLRRKTLSRGQVASVASLWHPASRYQFTGGFWRGFMAPGFARGRIGSLVLQSSDTTGGAGRPVSP
jgi:hypothetical protein